MHRYSSGALLLAVITSVGSAQAPLAQPQKAESHLAARVVSDRVAGRARLNIDSYDEDLSRALFRTCDLNADDRLDIIEATKAIEYLISGQSIDSFRRLDKDSDGYLSFSEFDQEYHAVVQRGGTLRLLPSRPLALPRGRVESSDLLQAKRLVALYDTDGDELLSAREFAILLERRRLPGDRAAHFQGLDSDGSGSLSAEELTGFARLQGVAVAPDADLGAHTRLPEPFREADLNQDGAIAGNELERLLRRIDPGLRLWTKTIVTNADKSGNGTLGLPEIQAALLPPPPPPKLPEGMVLTPEQRKLADDLLKARTGK